MLKAVAVAIIALTSLSAQAVNFEIGGGLAIAQPMPNGTWYQEGLPYKLSLKTKQWFIGINGDINNNWRWHLDYVNLGTLKSDAIATTDADYNNSTHSCYANPCVAQTRFIGSGTTNGVKATAEYHITKNDIEYNISAGIFAFKPEWTEILYNWTDSPNRPAVPGPLVHNIQTKMTYRPTIGAGIRYKNTEVRVDYYQNKSYSSAETGIAKGTTTISIVYHF
jgi:hypothetical protein